jgi:cellulose synthase/poly-beta-1,6-N-acetylglucosamine synthase-like glycosyltransferase
MTRPHASEQPSVSVVVPVFNSETTIGECLRCISILDYDRKKLEVIVVDDGSTDKTIEKIQGYAVRLIRKKHGGYPSAMNAGIKAATGDLVLNIDSDTYVSKEWLTKIVEEFKDPKVGIAGGYVATAPTSSFWGKLAGFESEDRSDKVKSKYVDFITSTCTVYRRKMFMEVGLFNEELKRGSDEDLAQRAINAGWKIVFRKDAVCYHDWSTSIMTYFKKQALNMVYEVKSILQHKELLRGKEEHPASLYIPLIFMFTLLLGPLWILIDVLWIPLFSCLGLIVYHVPQTIRIIRKHKDLSMLLFPIAINIRYIAWLIGLGLGIFNVLRHK